MSTDVVEFLSSFESGSVTKVKILGHTGRSIIAPVERFAADREASGVDTQVAVQILLRDKGAESPRRRAQTLYAEERARGLSQRFSWLKIELRFYSALQTLRGTIVEFADGSKQALFSAYEWTLQPHRVLDQQQFQPIRTTAVNWSMRLKSNKSKTHEQDRLLSILENWFDYYWGPGLIHTVAFDFDDTIVDTYEDKIKAWIFGIEQMLAKHGSDHFAPEFVQRFSVDATRFPLMKEILDSIAEASEIQKNILRKAPSELKDFLEQQRSAYRRHALFPPQMSEMELADHVNSKLFAGVKEAFQEIRSKGYSIAVASLTDEERIESALKLANIPHVGIIVGKDEYQDRELKELVKNAKIFLLRKIANLSGVPVSRVLYVGDHELDEQAAKAIGSAFIHARLIPSIKKSADERTLSFEAYFGLTGQIRLAESRLRASNDVPRARRHY